MTKAIRRQAIARQIERLQHRRQTLRQISNRISWIRIGVFFGGLLLSGLAFFFIGAWLFWMTLVATLGLFGGAVYCHRQIETGLTRHQVWLEIKAAQIARMDLDWPRMPSLTWAQPRHDHPFEADLDLVGEDSLHRLVDRAVSHEGSQRLRAWLTEPVPNRAEIVRRQSLVRELIPRSLFRDKLILNAVVAGGARRMWDAKRLLNWLDSHDSGASLRLWLLLFTGLVMLNLVLLALNVLGWIPPLWQFSFVIYFGLLLAKARLFAATFNQAIELQEAFHQLGAVFRQLERFSYRGTPHLKTLCAPFLDPGQRPSQHLLRVSRVAVATALRKNPIIWLILNGLLPWDSYFAYRLHRYKTDMARFAPAWLDAWFELEALSSLANLAYLNPDYSLPALLEDGTQDTQNVFQAISLGHPLIPDQERVSNDFVIRRLGETAIITGSNMAGKSTFLRTVGLNLALAFAGGPVNARSLQTRLFRLFTCIKVSDSVTNGISYFYAEVKCLKALLSSLEADHPLPLCFFIDEIFRGTNNRERFIGSQAYLRALVGKHGVGLVSTHDLELARLADQLSQVKNYHFKDDVLDDRMVFDYVLSPGPCPTTNALKIMQMEGLPVDAEQIDS